MPAPPRFTLEEIQAHALAIVDRDGVAGLSMRTLAASLGTGPMTLYNYVADRTALEELIVDAIAAEATVPDPSPNWARDVKAIATAMWTTARKHPAAIPLVLTRRTSSEASLRAADALVAALARGGLGGVALLAAFRTVMSYVMGIAQAELAGPLSRGEDSDPSEAAKRIERLARPDYPSLAALAKVSRRSTPEKDFDRGLEIILRGLQRPK